MKRLTALFIAIIMCVALASCRSEEQSEGGSSVPENTSTSQNESVADNSSALPDEDEQPAETPKGSFEYEYDESIDGIVILKFIGSEKDVVIPAVIDDKQVKKVAAKAFFETAVETVVIPAGVDRVLGEVFSGCASLKKVSLPAGIKLIAVGAFSGCASLTDINIPVGTIKISKNAFHDCTALTKLVIPDTANAIEDGAFNGCNALTSITYRGQEYKSVYEFESR